MVYTKENDLLKRFSNLYIMIGDGKMNVKDIAKLAGVSIGTVSRVINNNKSGVGSKKREEILRIIEETGFVPSSIARSMITKHSSTIGLIIPDISNPFFPLLAKGVEEYAQKEGYSLFLCNTNGNDLYELKQIAIMKEKQVDGIIISSCKGNDSEHILKIISGNTPIVFVDEPVACADVFGVYLDNLLGGYQTTKHLIDLNHQKIAYFTGPKESLSSYHRLDGYKKALQEANIPFDEELVAFGSYSKENGYNKFMNLIQKGKKFTAILAASDVAACGIYSAARECGLSIPTDISVAGFDNVLSDNISLSPPILTTVNQPTYQMGEMAIEILIKRINGIKPRKKIIEFEPELVIRSSTEIRR